MAKYTAIEPLLTKAGRVEPGESVELGERQAKQLLELGAIEPRKSKSQTAAEEAAERAEAKRKAAEEAAAAEQAEAYRKAAEEAAAAEQAHAKRD